MQKPVEDKRVQLIPYPRFCISRRKSLTSAAGAIPCALLRNQSTAEVRNALDLVRDSVNCLAAGTGRDLSDRRIRMVAVRSRNRRADPAAGLWAPGTCSLNSTPSY